MTNNIVVYTKSLYTFVLHINISNQTQYLFYIDELKTSPSPNLLSFCCHKACNNHI